MANLNISTTQNVQLEYKIASIGERILALLIDLSIFILYFYIVSLLTSFFNTIFTDHWTVFGLQNLLLLPVMFYSLYMHILFNGKTVGKMLVKTQVVRVDGSPPHWSHYMIRWMLRLVDLWIFFGAIAALTILFSNKRQRLGDAAAGTVVISTKNKIKITHTILEEIEETYQPTFLNVTQLTDKDVRLIKETYQIALQTSDYKTLKALRNKVAEVLQIKSDLYDKQFIDVVLKDYNYFTRNM